MSDVRAQMTTSAARRKSRLLSAIPATVLSTGRYGVEGAVAKAARSSIESIYAGLMVAETSHKDGEEGVLLAKQWLESTTHIELPFSVYDVPHMTSLLRLDGTLKRYDLHGHFIRSKSPLYVEVKKYNVVGKQPEEYTEYLANAYSITARGIKDGLDRKPEFMWVTWHPFAQSKWPHLTSRGEIRSALELHSEALDGQEIDDDLLRTVEDRLWLLVLNSCQERLFLTRDEPYKVEQALARKGE